MNKLRQKFWQGIPVLVGIYIVNIIVDRLWFSFDQNVPAWDQADYLNGAVNYWEALQKPEWFDSQWWRSFWLLSNKIPPLVYLLTTPFFRLFGVSLDSGTLVMLLFSALLLLSTYGLGITLFKRVDLGLWAAGICLLLPGLYRYRLEFLLDYPLTATVVFNFWLLSIWKFKPKPNKWTDDWLYMVVVGVSLGAAFLLKQTALFFLVLPLIYLAGSWIKQRRWLGILQLIVAGEIAIALGYPWYRTNWLLILTSGRRATITSAIAEGDPSLNTLDAWLYYLKIIPLLVGYPLLFICLAGLIYYLITRFKFKPKLNSAGRWLGVYLVGGYLLSSLNVNKDARYILPLLPVLAIGIAASLLAFQGKWGKPIRKIAILTAVLVALGNLFPLAGISTMAQTLSPRVQHHPYRGKSYPHARVIQTIVHTNPYLKTVLGVLPSTPTVNQHNFSFYGGLQVSGRQVGVRSSEVWQDARSLDWFVTKTGDQGSVPAAQSEIVELVETSGEFKLQESWQLPEGSSLNLYHRLTPTVEIEAVSTSVSQIQLETVKVPPIAPPDKPIPITYSWIGSWQQLQPGLVILTWKSDRGKWLHDRAIGMGQLYSQIKPDGSFRVVETTAMFPGEVPPGEYSLEATYLNRDTGETYSIAVPPVSITIKPQAVSIPAPELDLVTQLREIAPNLAQGISGLEPIFTQTARINQYDAVQDYLKQAEISLAYRLRWETNLNWLYSLTLANVLQQDVSGAIDSLKQIISLDDSNPYHYAYLAFVYLYDWQPQPAQIAIARAKQIDASLPELEILEGVAALMQGNLVKAWQIYHQS